MTGEVKPPTAVALTVAGSDSGGGAGIQADLKTFAAHRVYGTSALTLITAQNTRRVSHVRVLDTELIEAQIERVLEDFPVAAVKTGALGNAQAVRAVARALAPYNLPLIVDPVMVAKSGDMLLEEDAVEALLEELVPPATLLTPNAREAERLFALPAGALATSADLEALARRLNGVPVLLKGGHVEGDEVVDYLSLAGKVEPIRFARLATRHTHGTGCALSAAIAARVARGEALAVAVRGARAYVQAAISAAPALGAGAGPLEFQPTSLSELREV